MYKEVLEQVVSKMFNLATNEEVASLLYEKNGDEIKVRSDAAQSILDKYATKIKQLKDKETEAFNNGVKKTEKELLSKKESELKSYLKETYDFESDKETYTDIAKDFIEKQSAKTSVKSKLTDDDVKKHPLFMKIESEYNKLKPLEAEYPKLKEEFEGYKKQEVRRDKLNTVKAHALVELKKLNPTFYTSYKDQQKISNLEKIYLDRFEQFDDFAISEEDIFAIKGEKRYEDKLGNPVKFKQLAKQLADELFEYQVQPPKGSTNNQNEPPVQPIKMPETKEEWVKTCSTLKGKELVEMGDYGKSKGW